MEKSSSSVCDLGFRRAGDLFGLLVRSGPNGVLKGSCSQSLNRNWLDRIVVSVPGFTWFWALVVR